MIAGRTAPPFVLVNVGCTLEQGWVKGWGEGYFGGTVFILVFFGVYWQGTTGGVKKSFAAVPF